MVKISHFILTQRKLFVSLYFLNKTLVDNQVRGGSSQDFASSSRAEPSHKYFGSSRAEPNEFLKIRAKTEPRSAGSASQCIAEPANLGSSRAELDFAEPITSRAKSEPGKTVARAEPSRAEPWLDPPLELTQYSVIFVEISQKFLGYPTMYIALPFLHYN